MYLGQIMEKGSTEEIFSPQYHPYTEAVLSARPIADTTVNTPRSVLPGDTPALPRVGVAAEAVSFAAGDRVAVFADYYPAEREAAPIVLLFHQAGSNRGEYATIAPLLVKLGFAALAVDQRSGGTAWGRANETVQHLGHSASYGEA